MNKLLLASALLLAGCSQQNANQAAISTYIKSKLGDPNSYQPVRWGKPRIWHKSDADTAAATAMMPAYAAQATRAEQGLDRLKDESVETGSAWEAGIKKRMLLAAGRADSLADVGQALRDSKDTAHVGVLIPHAFRAKNKMGGLVLDSVRFVVTKNGIVSTY